MIEHMFDARELSQHPVDIGIRTEGAILGELSRRGYDVLSPFSYNHRYDYVIDLGNRFLKAQCKTGRYVSGVVQFNKVSTRCSRTSVHRRSYADEVDMFLVYSPALETTYVVPMEDAMAGVSWLRVDPPANSQNKKINWARDYILGSGSRALVALPLVLPPRIAAVPE
jgi:hypothetical protein